ncbi:putative magnesium transporter NIPA [Lyophyllum shimeji]|uniref:Magnesium transporter NIPA n=1 Tax=Lyophyllum shimeji TaxID=47721 RepID=A0A9P3PCV7_LYOSH|nr:putative magnesium transporter NIPA [Lyophyllum shimeji]
MLASAVPGDALFPAQGSQLSLAAFRSMDGLPKLTTATFIGIMIAITGNILISLALNLQKLAHKRVEAEIRARDSCGQNGKRAGNGNMSIDPVRRRRSDGPSLNESDEDRTSVALTSTQTSPGSMESQPLIPFPHSSTPPADYGTTLPIADNAYPERSQPSAPHKSKFFSRLAGSWFRRKARRHPSAVIPVDVVTEEAVLRAQRTGQKATQKQDILEEGNETAYLKSKLWWSGFLLMNVGEMGNFISYAWAPASVVAPLGTFALMANCLFAPFLLGERFRKRDLLGILIAAIGAVTVVLASNSSDTRLDPDGLLHAIAQTAFIVYSCIYVVAAIILATLSEGEVGRRWVFVDVGLCALFGGFTVLCTKAISTLLTMGTVVFSSWITYPVLLILISTGIGQIRYLNRALMRFDGKVVIPIQFVLFTLSAIIGSAILYGDFRKAKFHQIVTFLYGCAATFLGVFIISWAPSSESEGAVEDAGESGSAGPLPTSTEETRPGFETFPRRKRAKLVIPNGTGDTPISSLIGLSPAQHLLLVHTPPREHPMHGSMQNTPDRRRTMSWLGDGTREIVSPEGTQDDSHAGRTRHSSATTTVGSFDHNAHW